MKDIFHNKTILITGGVGSIGSVITETLLTKYSPKQIRIFDQNEEELFLAESKYSRDKRARFLVGNIRDKERVVWAMRGIDYVFHAAALKHVAINEYNPFEAIKTNIAGTENVVMAAIEEKVKKFINISSDKASLPFSTMGASKLLAERITTAANYYKGSSPTICASVRFGNVLASSGSVIPIFCQQIKNGQPVTITDRRMIRYFMTIPQAVNLILKATAIARGGEVFILKMPSVRILDLAQVLIEEYAPICHIDPKKITIQEIGIRPGEKISEKLVTPIEAEYALEMEDMFIIPPLVENPSLNQNAIKHQISYYHQLGAKSAIKGKIQKSNLLSKKQIKQLLKNINII